MLGKGRYQGLTGVKKFDVGVPRFFSAGVETEETVKAI